MQKFGFKKYQNLLFQIRTKFVDYSLLLSTGFDNCSYSYYQFSFHYLKHDIDANIKVFLISNIAMAMLSVLCLALKNTMLQG